MDTLGSLCGESEWWSRLLESAREWPSPPRLFNTCSLTSVEDGRMWCLSSFMCRADSCVLYSDQGWSLHSWVLANMVIHGALSLAHVAFLYTSKPSHFIKIVTSCAWPWLAMWQCILSIYISFYNVGKNFYVTCTCHLYIFCYLVGNIGLGQLEPREGLAAPKSDTLPTEKLLSIMIMVMPILCCSEEEASKCAHHSYRISSLVSALNFVKSLNIY